MHCGTSSLTILSDRGVKCFNKLPLNVSYYRCGTDITLTNSSEVNQSLVIQILTDLAQKLGVQAFMYTDILK